MNQTGNVTIIDDDADVRHWISIFFMSVAALISQILTIGGNILVLVSFKVERRLHKPSNYFLLSLAVADLIIGCFSMPVYSLYLILGYWPFGDFVCDLWISVDYACSEVSVLNLIMISIDRLWSVSSPAKYRNKMTLRRAVFMIIPTWVAPTALFFTTVMGWSLITGQTVQREGTECYLPYMEDSPVFMTILTILVYWIPLAAMMGMYMWIFSIIRNLGNAKGRETRKITNPNPLPSRASQDQVCVIQPLEPTAMETEAHLVTNDTTTTTTSTISNTNGGLNDTCRPLSIPGKMPDIESETEPVEDTSSSSRKNESEYPDPSIKEPEKKMHYCDGKQLKHIRKFKPSNIGRTTKRRKSHKGERQSRSERKATKTLSFILGAFFVTWSPYSTIVILLAWYTPATMTLNKFYEFSYYLCYINSTINPLCYAFANELFRNTFYKILTGRVCKR